MRQTGRGEIDNAAADDRNYRRRGVFRAQGTLTVRRNVKRLISALPVLFVLGAGAPAAAAATPPGASTGGATAVAPQTATVHGKVNPHGAPTAFYFRYGTTTKYGHRTTTTSAGSGTKTRSVSAPLAGLRPITTSHSRLVAFSTAGTRTGGDRTFKTKQIPTTSSIAVSPNPVAFGGLISYAVFCLKKKNKARHPYST